MMGRHRIFIGHYVDAPKRWFICVADGDEEEIMQEIDDIEGEPDLRSIKEMTGFFIMDFEPDFEDDELGNVKPVSDDILIAELDSPGMNAVKWIEKLHKKPLPPVASKMTDKEAILSDAMRVKQAEIIRRKIKDVDKK